MVKPIRLIISITKMACVVLRTINANIMDLFFRKEKSFLIRPQKGAKYTKVNFNTVITIKS
jgi:hypothetical protein